MKDTRVNKLKLRSKGRKLVGLATIVSLVCPMILGTVSVFAEDIETPDTESVNEVPSAEAPSVETPVIIDDAATEVIPPVADEIVTPPVEPLITDEAPIIEEKQQELIKTTEEATVKETPLTSMDDSITKREVIPGVVEAYQAVIDNCHSQVAELKTQGATDEQLAQANVWIETIAIILESYKNGAPENVLYDIDFMILPYFDAEIQKVKEELATQPIDIAVTGVELTAYGFSVSKGATLQFEAVVTPTNATNKAVTWVTSDSSIATIDENGLLTAVSSGSVTVTVTTIDGGYSVTATGTVEEDMTPPVVTKEAFQQVINDSLSRKQADYTAESWAAANLTAVIAHANTVLTDEHASQQEVDAETALVQSALAKLVKATPVDPDKPILPKPTDPVSPVDPSQPILPNPVAPVSPVKPTTSAPSENKHPLFTPLSAIKGIKKENVTSETLPQTGETNTTHFIWGYLTLAFAALGAFLFNRKNKQSHG